MAAGKGDAHSYLAGKVVAERQRKSAEAAAARVVAERQRRSDEAVVTRGLPIPNLDVVWGDRWESLDLHSQIEDGLRDRREVDRLMIPNHYNGRDSKAPRVRHVAG